jgi:hypothetical protein
MESIAGKGARASHGRSQDERKTPETQYLMPKKVWVVLIAVALCVYATHIATHIYEERQSYKTGVYIGKAAFNAADYQNRRCVSLPANSFQHGCEVRDLNKDSAMEDDLASANIIPALSGSTALHTGFRDGWREARTAAFASR